LDFVTNVLGALSCTPVWVQVPQNVRHGSRPAGAGAAYGTRAARSSKRVGGHVDQCSERYEVVGGGQRLFHLVVPGDGHRVDPIYRACHVVDVTGLARDDGMPADAA
jgi:hypothetical protein